MTIKELKTLLSKYDNDMEVIIETSDSYDFEDFTVDMGFDKIVIKEF